MPLFGRSARRRPPAPCARVGLWLSFVHLGAFASARWVSARPAIYSRLCGCVSLLASPPAPAPLAAQTHGRGLNSPPAVSGAGPRLCLAREIYILSQLVRNLGHAWYMPYGIACLCYTASLFPLRNMPLHDITPSRVNKRSAPLTWRDVPCVTYYERSVHNEANQ